LNPARSLRAAEESRAGDESESDELSRSSLAQQDTAGEFSQDAARQEDAVARAERLLTRRLACGSFVTRRCGEGGSIKRSWR
jgi:hypothetical protein